MSKLKLSKVIAKLQKIQKQLRVDPDCVVDFETDLEGEALYFDLEDVSTVEDNGVILLNFKSSNEM